MTRLDFSISSIKMAQTSSPIISSIWSTIGNRLILLSISLLPNPENIGSQRKSTSHLRVEIMHTLVEEGKATSTFQLLSQSLAI